jgi:uncharacterized Tic20 family protein
MTTSQKLTALALVLPVLLLTGDEIIVNAQGRDVTEGVGQFIYISIRTLAVWSFFIGLTAALVYSRFQDIGTRSIVGWALLIVASVYLVAGALGALGLVFWVAPYVGTMLVMFLPVSLLLFSILLRPSARALVLKEEAEAADAHKRGHLKVQILAFLACIAVFALVGAIAKLATVLGATVIATTISFALPALILIYLAIYGVTNVLQRQERGLRKRARRLQ